MFRWLTTWFKRRRFERERMIFEFWDGAELRRIDPLVAYMTLRDHEEFNLETHPIIVAETLEEPEVGIFCRAMCEAFGVTRFDPATEIGLTIEELADLLTDFILYMNAIQKKTRDGSTPTPPTATESSASPADPSEATNSLSQCATAASAPISDADSSLPKPSSQDSGTCSPSPTTSHSTV